MGISKNLTRGAILLMTTGFLTACDNITIPSLGLRTQPTQAPPSINRPQPDSRGIITYETYQVMVAREGDTIASMAGRAGLSPEELGRHNGLETTHAPRVGAIVALPENVGGTVVTTPTGWSPEIATQAIQNASTSGGIGGSTPSVGTPNAPLRHRVEAGETAYSIGRIYNVSVTALASWNGLGPDLGVRVGQELIIPVPDTARIAATTPPAATTPTVAPAVTPAVVAPTTPSAPVNSSASLVKPVDGSIIRGFNASSGSNKSDGIDYSVAAGTNVRVAAAGTVALVSQSNGALGTIVLVRHAGGFLTVYGRVSGVTVAKGDTVTSGQVIGVVASGDNPSLHFEVRKGTEPVDPAPYLK